MITSAVFFKFLLHTFILSSFFSHLHHSLSHLWLSSELHLAGPGSFIEQHLLIFCSISTPASLFPIAPHLSSRSEAVLHRFMIVHQATPRKYLYRCERTKGVPNFRLKPVGRLEEVLAMLHFCVLRKADVPNHVVCVVQTEVGTCRYPVSVDVSHDLRPRRRK